MKRKIFVRFFTGPYRTVWDFLGYRIILVFVVLLLPLLMLPALVRADPHLTADLPKPTNISCQGYEQDTVVVRWKDTAEDETNYRVERSIDGAAFSEVATLTPDGSGNYSAYQDTGIDTTQNRRYRVRSFRSSDSNFSPYSDICNNPRIYETDNFRIFYRLLGGTDDCPQIDGQDVCLTDITNGDGLNIYVALQETALEGSVDAFSRLGFDRDASQHSSLDKIPINVVWCDGGGCAGGGGLGLSPYLMEMPFDLGTRLGDPVAWIVALHEAFHFQQFKYWGLNDPHNKWVVEGQARSIQDKICVGGDRSDCEHFDDIPTGYAGYVPEINAYLGNTNRPINQTSYQAALFWTYLTEKYGTNPSSSDSVERGMDIMIEFWKNSADTPGRHGVAVLNETLTELGHTEQFRDVWKDFAVANYAKDLSGSGVQAKYQYADMAETGGNYATPNLHLDSSLALDEQLIDTDETVKAWGARYYEVRPDADVPIIDIQFTQDSTFQLYYTILAIKGTDVAYEYNTESRHLSKTLINDAYDKVVVVVAGLDHQANYRYSFNGTQPTLNIVRPTTSNKALVGNPTSPDKFLVQIEVLAGDGTPLEGVDINTFSFAVAGTDLPADNILTAATVQGQHWFVLRAPVQLSAGLYDFQATYGATTLSSTETDALDYTVRSDADNMLVIDHSGSMGSNNKMESAKNAASLYVDSWRAGDAIGIVGFDSTASLDMDLQPWSDSPAGGSRQTALDTIDALVASGETAIGEALDTAWTELKTDSDADTSHDWVLVLLSDGLSNNGSPSFDEMITQLGTTTDKQPQVHAIAVGPDADRLRMQEIADDTGGSYHAVSIPSASLAAGGSLAATDNLRLNMDYSYRVIATEAVGQQQFFNLFGPVNDGDGIQDIITIPVEGSVAELVLSLSWDSDGWAGDIFLRDPDNVGGYSAQYDYTNRHIVWRIATPKQGDWTLTFQTQIPGLASTGAQPTQQTEWLPSYLIHSSVRSDVTMDVYLATPVDERTPGTPMPIIASLTDTGPIANATVVASIVKPDASTKDVTLYDDGNHGDGAADDGIYSGTFYQTGLPGSYNVTVEATGNSSVNGDFTRQAVLSFHIISEGEEDITESQPEGGIPTIFNDSDGDGIPDEWEEENGTDPNTDDASEDPDRDGLPNTDEWKNGTDPHNPDTDNGGESDGSETGKQRDPLDPSDDQVLEAPWLQAYPRDAAVYLWHTLDPDYAVVGFYRGDNPDGPFDLIGQNSPGTGIYTDTNVVNGTTYCYIAVALDSALRLSGHRDASCVTPNADPIPPHGGILINDGDEATRVPTVTLTLWASDVIDPESEIPDDPIPQAEKGNTTFVQDMKIGNKANLSDGNWEPYATSKGWVLDTDDGLATVFVQYRDAEENESAIYPAAILVDPDLAIAVESVAISGPTSGETGMSYDFTASVTPVTATLPISYSWEIDGQSPIDHPGRSSTSDTIGISWENAGTYDLLVTATSSTGSVTDVHTIAIEESTKILNITLDIAQTTLPADGSSTTLVTAIVQDDSNAPVSNQSVTFATTLGTVMPASATTDANGRATTVLQAGTTTGTAIVTASTQGISDDGEVLFVEPTPSEIASIVLTAAQTTLPADGSSTIVLSATVRDTNNGLVSNQTVAFTSSLGTVTPATSTTDANGVATTMLQTSTTTGTAMVIASTNGLSDVLDIQFVEPAITPPVIERITLVAAQTTLPADGSSTTVLSATVRDTNNGLVSNQAVTFTTSLGIVTPATSTTDANGVATTVLQAGTTPGTATVVASTDGVSDTLGILFEEPGLPGEKSITLTAAQTMLPADGSSTTVLSATVRDENNMPVSNQTVSFATTLGTILLERSITDATGVAMTVLQAASTPGTATVTASTDGVTDDREIVFEEVSAPAGMNVSIVTERTTIPADGNSTTGISVTVRDGNNVPVSNQTVTFATSLGTVTPATTTTDANGVASAVLQSTTTGGTAIVTVTIGDIQRIVAIAFETSDLPKEHVIYLATVMR